MLHRLLVLSCLLCATLMGTAQGAWCNNHFEVPDSIALCAGESTSFMWWNWYDSSLNDLNPEHATWISPSGITTDLSVGEPFEWTTSSEPGNWTATFQIGSDASTDLDSCLFNIEFVILTNPNPGIDNLAPLCLNNPEWPNYQLFPNPQPAGNPGIASWTVDWGNGSDTTFTSVSVFDPPGTQYFEFGYQTVTIDVVGNNGCTTQVVDSLFVGNNPQIGSANPGNTDGLCSPYLLEFPITDYTDNADGTTYNLDFGDGSGTLTYGQDDLDPVPPTTVSHEYVLSSCNYTTPEGSQNAFRFRIEAVNECGTSVTTVDPIRIHLEPDPAIGGPDEVCMNQSFEYTISGTGQIVTDSECNDTQSFWEITSLNGQANVSQTQGQGTGFTTAFPAPGEYQINVLDLHPNCPNGNDQMMVCVYPELLAQGTAAPSNGCAPLTVNLEDLSQNPAICGEPTTQWIVAGPGHTWVSGGPNDVAPVVKLTSAGTYTITLRVAIPDKDACPPDEQVFTIEVMDPELAGPLDCEITGCSNPLACNFDPFATYDDGSCLLPFDLGWCNCEGDVFDALGNCGGNCPQDIDGDGVCDGLGCLDNAACNYSSVAIVDDGSCQYGCIYCDTGTYWNSETQTCMVNAACLFDSNNDGLVGIGDVLMMLQAFGQPCD